MAFIKEFKKFAVRGNVIDLAVGIIIGTAFGAITKSLVDDVITPIVTLITGGVDFSDQSFVLREATEMTAEVTINYGLFVNTLINFVIIALALFVVVKQVNRLQREKAPTEPTEKKCQFCKSTISVDATRCPNCTSELSSGM